jgi:hypothetical protein
LISAATAAVLKARLAIARTLVLVADLKVKLVTPKTSAAADLQIRHRSAEHKRDFTIKLNYF